MGKLRSVFKKWLYGSCPGFAGRFPYYGTSVHFPPRATLFRAVCEHGTFEPDVTERLVQSARPDATVFDVGANIGLMAIPVLRSNPSCRVVSFEPSPNSLPFLIRTAAESAYRDRWTVVGKGLSDQCGETDFVVGRPEDAVYEGFKKSDRTSAARVVKVPITTLDEEWRQLSRPYVSSLKVDVEGAEGLVLAGGAELFHACHPDVVIEWHPPYLRRFGTPSNQLLSFARTFNYRVYTIPAGVPVDDDRTLRVQSITCQNYLLLS
jgi:FkbM family methyltransferase